MHTSVRGQCPRVGALLLSCGSQGYNSDPGAWQQVSLPTEPSCNPHTSILSLFFYLALSNINRVMCMLLLHILNIIIFKMAFKILFYNLALKSSMY